MEKKEAMKILKDFHDKSALFSVRTALDTIIPELKESKDERIRKKLLSSFKDIMADADEDELWYGLPYNDIISWLEKQGESYTKKDVDDAYLKGVTDTKNEIEKQYEANYQIRKDIATFIFNYRGDIKDRAKWMNFLDIKVSFVEEQDDKPQGKSALEAVNEEKVDNANKVEPKFRIGDFVKNTNYQGEPIYEIVYIDKECYICEYRGKENMGDKTVMHFAFDNPYLRLVEQKPAWSEEDENLFRCAIDAVEQESKVRTDGCLDEEVGGMVTDWLKSIKDRVQPQKQWKPSEGQLECLGYAIEKARKDWSPLTNNRIYLTLKTLKEQLEKL